MDDKASIRIILKSYMLSLDSVSEWFTTITCFKPVSMRGKSLTNNKAQKYNSKKFFEGISKELESNDIVKISIADEQNSISLIRGAYNSDVAWLTCSLTYELFQQNKSSILKFIDDIMLRYDGIVASICSLEDEFWQDNEDIDYYHIKGKSLEEIHVKKSPIFEDDMIVDTEYNPGHSHIIDGIWFGSCWGMWFGEEYFKYIPKNVLVNFKQCYENEELGNKVIRVLLYKDTWEYDMANNRDIQMRFRKQVGVDEVSHQLISSLDTSKESDPSIEISTRNHDYRGLRSITYYYDMEGLTVPKSIAKRAKVYVLNDKGEVITSEEKNIN